jgi:DNA-binding response OmpR family regulator
MEDRILIVDDEKSITDSVSYAFRREGYLVESASNGIEALDKIRSFKPKIIIMDIMMPKLNGYEVLKRIDKTSDIGVIFLTAKSDIVDKVVGLELGADDYIVKPFDIREIVARVNSLSRRLIKSNEVESKANIIEIESLKIMEEYRKVTIEGNVIELTQKEYELLVLLLKNPEKVYSRDELLDRIWGLEYIGGTRTVDIHIQRVRKKLGDRFQSLIQTVHGIGYKCISYEK